MTDPTRTQDHVLIFDTTLRDGALPGATMTLHEKLQIATLLDEDGVDIIEVMFAIASDANFKGASQIAARRSAAFAAAAHHVHHRRRQPRAG